MRENLQRITLFPSNEVVILPDQKEELVELTLSYKLMSFDGLPIYSGNNIRIIYMRRSDLAALNIQPFVKGNTTEQTQEEVTRGLLLQILESLGVKFEE
jgi:hypothetical protein